MWLSQKKMIVLELELEWIDNREDWKPLSVLMVVSLDAAATTAAVKVKRAVLV